MPILFDYDAETGMKTMFDYDPVKDQVFLTYEQDVTVFLDRMKQFRDNPDYWKNGVKEDWAYYASIPPVIEMELMKKGLHLHNSAQTKEILKEINTNYPYLRATEKWHR
jgi:hypothetical protein